MQKINISYSTIKQILLTAPSYFLKKGTDGYILFVVGDDIFSTCEILPNDTSSKNDFISHYKSKCIEVPSADDALMLGNIKNGIPLVSPRAPDGRVKVVNEKGNGSSLTIYSHDWTDPTTWYTSSVYVFEETLTNPNNDGYKYYSVHNNIIDLCHGKITAEDYLKDKDGYSYLVSVKVDGYSKTEQDPHYGYGGDFIVNYEDGYIIFNNQVDSNSVVKMTYHYATDSTFTIAPRPGKMLRINEVEIQFSKDIEITDSASFQPYIYVDVVAPQLLISNGGYLPSQYKIPITNPLVYKTIADYFSDAKLAYPNYDALGGTGWRGMTSPAITMHWNYDQEKVLRDDYGMEIRLKLQHDLPFNGTFANATFYCLSEDLTG